MKGQIQTEYYTAGEDWGGIGGRFFLTIRKTHYTKCYKGTYPYKDYTNAQFAVLRKVQSYNIIDISWESKEKRPKEFPPPRSTTNKPQSKIHRIY